MKHFIFYSSLWVVLLCVCVSCRNDVALQLEEDTPLEETAGGASYRGFYLLNEGNMGMNKSTLDFYDFDKGVYHRNIYAERNPTVPKELGDVGNDLKIYADRMYAVINSSNKVEVMDAATAKRIGQVDIPNCRYIAFQGNYAYVTSYAGPVEINPDYQQKGYVAKIDLITLQETARCLVGFQPDELAVSEGKLFVANSGGYRGAGSLEGYERTLSVVDLNTFTEERRIDVDYNLHRVRADRQNNLWVSSRGDYKGHPSRLFFVDREKMQVTDSLPIAVSDMWIDGDSLYYYSTEWNYATFSNRVSYGIVNIVTHQIVSTGFITDGTDKQIEVPYGIMVHPVTKDIYITDAGNYVDPGMLYCFNRQGKKKWSVVTGDISAHFVLLKR